MTVEIDPNALIDPRHYGVSGPPHELWTEMRRSAPVHFCESDDYEPFWAITRHADIMDISSRPLTFSNRVGPALVTKKQVADGFLEDGPFSKMRTIIQMDPPEHRDFRRVASGFFTPRSIGKLEKMVTECAREHVDALGDEGECDFVEAIAQRYPLRILSTILGVDREQEERIQMLTQQLFAGDDPDLARQAESREQAQVEIAADFFGLFNRIADDRRAHPRDDLASLLANAKLDSGEPLNPIELFGYYLIVFTAGHDTTRNTISGGMAALLEHPDQFALLRASPELAPKAVEEILRWTSVVNYMRRTLQEDVELHGQKLRKREHLVLFYASANRDAAIFERPFEFDITRHPNRHLAFGTGEHFCLGAHLARLSSRTLFRELASRVESIELAGDLSQIAASFVVGLKSLPIRYKIRRAS